MDAPALLLQQFNDQPYSVVPLPHGLIERSNSHSRLQIEFFRIFSHYEGVGAAWICQKGF